MKDSVRKWVKYKSKINSAEIMQTQRSQLVGFSIKKRRLKIIGFPKVFGSSKDADFFNTNS